MTGNTVDCHHGGRGPHPDDDTCSCACHGDLGRSDDSAPSGQHDAHVQVLTAEVRTLMVGSRQVTLSVAKQLDVVPLYVMRPFGRVKIRTGSRGSGRLGVERVDVIGAHRDGSLCISWLSTGETRSWYRGPGGQVNPEIGAQDWERLCELPLIVLAGLR